MMAILCFLITASMMPTQPSPSNDPGAQKSPRSGPAGTHDPRHKPVTASHGQQRPGHKSAIRPQEKPIVLVLSTPTTRLDLAQTVRFCGLLLAPYGFTVLRGARLTAIDFPGQIDEARKAAEASSAIAVAWYREVPSPSGPNRLFLHVLDLVTDKTLIRTVRIEGRSGSALHRAAALKIWSLLRASLLEVRAMHRKAAPAISHLIGDLSTKPSARSRHATAQTSHKGQRPTGSSKDTPGRRRAPRPPWASLTVGYSVGIFASGKVLHHAITLAASFAVKRWRKLALDVGIDLDLPFVPNQDLAGASLDITIFPVAAHFGLVWRHKRLETGAAIRCGLLVVGVDASLPDGSRNPINKTDPTVGLNLRIGYQIAKSAAIVAMASGDALLIGQDFEYNGEVLRMDRMRLAFGMGFEITLR